MLNLTFAIFYYNISEEEKQIFVEEVASLLTNLKDKYNISNINFPQKELHDHVYALYCSSQSTCIIINLYSKRMNIKYSFTTDEYKEECNIAFIENYIKQKKSNGDISEYAISPELRLQVYEILELCRFFTYQHFRDYTSIENTIIIEEYGNSELCFSLFDIEDNMLVSLSFQEIYE